MFYQQFVILQEQTMIRKESKLFDGAYYGKPFLRRDNKVALFINADYADKVTREQVFQVICDDKLYFVYADGLANKQIIDNPADIIGPCVRKDVVQNDEMLKKAYDEGFYDAWEMADELIYPNDLLTDEDVQHVEELASLGNKTQALKYIKEHASYSNCKQQGLSLKESALMYDLWFDKRKQKNEG